MNKYGIFDVIGPIMIGPSSSHTAGANKIGNLAKEIFGKNLTKVEFHLHGSFFKTYKGHGTDKALLAGVMGFNPDDNRIRQAYEIAKERNIDYSFHEADLGDIHPNSVKIIMRDETNEKIEVTGSSIGGGKIVINKINTTQVEFDGEYSTLMTKHYDKPGVIAKITKILSDENINVAFMKVFRDSKGQKARLVVQVDDAIDENTLAKITNIDAVIESKFIRCMESWQ